MQVSVEVNGNHIFGSPFFVTFANPAGNAKDAQPSSAKGDGRNGSGNLSNQDQTQPLQLADSDLSTVLNVGNISPQIDINQLRTMFVFFGKVLQCSYAGSNQVWANFRGLKNITNALLKVCCSEILKKRGGFGCR